MTPKSILFSSDLLGEKVPEELRKPYPVAHYHILHKIVSVLPNGFESRGSAVVIVRRGLYRT